MDVFEEFWFLEKLIGYRGNVDVLIVVVFLYFVIYGSVLVFYMYFIEIDIF